MTTENVRQLDQVTLNPDPASRSKDGNKGSRRGQRSWDGQRRPVNAELASVGRSVSRGSSSERESPLVSSRERPPPKSLSRGSKGSWRPRRSYAGSAIHGQAAGSVDATLLESNTNSSTSVSEFGMDYDQAAERGRIRDFYAQNGYMPAPREPLGALRRRLRVIRRLGLEHPSFHRETMDRFTRLAVNIFKAKGALVSIVAKDRQLFLSEIGFNRSRMELDIAICSHTIIGTGKQCMIVPDAKEDWRFRSNPLVDQGNGPIRFYAGAPLVVGNGSKSAIIGSLCVVDSQPRDFSKEDQLLLQDLAECVVSEVSTPSGK